MNIKLPGFDHIKPERITSPFQLLAFWIAGITLLGIMTLWAVLNASTLTQQLILLGIALLLLALLTLVIVLLVGFRHLLVDNPDLMKVMESIVRLKQSFEPTQPASPQGAASQPAPISWIATEEKRREIYAKNQGLFLVHAAWPSQSTDQVADIAIGLHQHGHGPLPAGRIKSVDYNLGPKFGGHTITQGNRRENFRLDISAYGPMLCLARVNFDDGAESVYLHRYIDFPLTWNSVLERTDSEAEAPALAGVAGGQRKAF